MRESSPEPIRDVLKNVVEGLSQPEKSDKSKILSAWPEVSGKGFSRHTTPVALRKGTLWVNVDESAWLYQANLQKEKLLKALKRKMGAEKIQAIRFRIGKI